MIVRYSPFLHFDSSHLDRVVARWRRPGECVKLKGKFDTKYRGWGVMAPTGRDVLGQTRTPGAYGGGTNVMMHPSVTERWRTRRT